MKNFIKKMFEKIKYTKAEKCPNCSYLLSKIPGKKKKCEKCNKYIYVRTSPTTNKKILVTEAGAKKIDMEWSNKINVSKWIQTLESFGVKNFEKAKKELSKKTSRNYNDNDAIWAILNKINDQCIGDYQMSSRINYTMALFLYDENRNFTHVLEESAKQSLLYADESRAKKVSICGGETSCSECKKNIGKTYSIEEAMKKMFIPCKKCSFELDVGKPGFCRCTYLGVYE